MVLTVIKISQLERIFETPWAVGVGYGAVPGFSSYTDGVVEIVLKQY
jgi:hypothetical protein